MNEKFAENAGVKMTLTRDPEASQKSGAVRRSDTKKRLSKRESVFYKPTEKDNKMLGELVLKVGWIDEGVAREAKIQDQHHTMQ